MIESGKAWSPGKESNDGVRARELACTFAEAAELDAEAAFWKREDLVYIGCLKLQPSDNTGYEYLADLEPQGIMGFRYKYGLVMLDKDQKSTQTLVCEIRDQPSDPFGFEMLVGSSWQIGPLTSWLDTLDSETKSAAVERYRMIIAWIRRMI